MQAELAQWGRTLHVHECLCQMDCGPCPALLPSGCPVQAKQLTGQPAPHGYHGCQEQLCLFQTPAFSLPAQQLSSGSCYHESPGLLPAPLSFDPLMVKASLAQPSPSPVPSTQLPGSSPLGSFSKLNALMSSPPDHLVPPQPLRLEQPTSGRLTSSSNPPAVLGPECPQNEVCLPALSGSSADWQKLPVDPSPHPPVVFPLFSSAKIHL